MNLQKLNMVNINHMSEDIKEKQISTIKSKIQN